MWPADLIPEVYKVVNPSFSRDDVVAALRDCDYSAEEAIRMLLEQEAYADFGAAEPPDATEPDSVFAMDD